MGEHTIVFENIFHKRETERERERERESERKIIQRERILLLMNRINLTLRKI